MQEERTKFPNQEIPTLCYIFPIHYVDSILDSKSGGTLHKGQRLLYEPTTEERPSSSLRRDMELVWSAERKWNDNVANLSILDENTGHQYVFADGVVVWRAWALCRQEYGKFLIVPIFFLVLTLRTSCC